MRAVRGSHVALAVMVFMYMGLFHAFADVPDTVQAVPISRLVDQSYAFDGRTVTIEGEVIGDIMKRGNHVWVTVLDGGIAVGVWVDNSSLRVKLTAGRYELEGDRVRATGVMYRACKEHGGDLDIHGESIELLAEGHPTGHPVSWIRKLAALLLCGAGLVFALMWRLRKRGTATA